MRVSTTAGCRAGDRAGGSHGSSGAGNNSNRCGPAAWVASLHRQRPAIRGAQQVVHYRNTDTNQAASAPPQPPPPPAEQQQQQQQGPTPTQPQQAAAAAQQPATARAGPDVLALDEDVRIIGLGQRGISAASRLMANPSLQGASCWMLDTDAKLLSSSKGANVIQVLEDDAQLTAQQLTQLAGVELPAAAAAAPVATLGAGSPATNGVAFLLAGAGGIPGGSTLLLQVAAHMRRAGLFVAVALTRPFDFEGRRKSEEASALVEALQDVANLVVVVPQAVLTRASAELTITDALEIADVTLETSCRAILWALGVPEVLLASSAGMLWHGRDLRLYKRLLSPPMEMLGTCPGVGHLGRGYASLPVDSLAAAGLASGLSTLAEDAVLAAHDSPFLDNIMPSASGVLCVLSLPARVLSHDFNVSPSALNDPEKYAIRAAVQVAAATVVELVGGRCDDVVVCAHVRHDWPHQDPAALCMEATLLVLEDPAAAEEKEDAAAAKGGTQSAAAASPAAAAAARVAARSSSGPLLHSSRPRQPQQPSRGAPAPAQQKEAAGQQLPTSSSRNWRAMSAIAGGSVAGAIGKLEGSKAQQPQSNPSPAGARRPPPPSSGSSARGGAGRGQPAAAGAPQQQRPAQEQQPAPGDDGLQLLPRLADKYVDTMVAQSLDLPPSAARWRRHQRRQNERSQARRASGHFAVAAVPWSAPGSRKAGGAQQQGAAADGFLAPAQDVWEEEQPAPPRDVKSRVAGMLQQERHDGSWDEEEEDAPVA